MLEELSFTLFSEGERKSSSIFFVKGGGSGGSSHWGCPGAVVASWGEQGWRAAGSLLPSVASVALPETLSLGVHGRAASGHRYPRVLHPAPETSLSLTGKEQGWGETQRDHRRKV